MTDLSRRRLFGRRERIWQPLPWLEDTDSFHDCCTRCNACKDRCEEQIIVSGDGGFPTIQFQQGECTFCYACADACPEHLFKPQSALPWQQIVKVETSCLALAGVTCRSCEDYCEPQAIIFRPRLGGPATPEIDSESCSGCGACIAPCANQSLSISPAEQHHGN